MYIQVYICTKYPLSTDARSGVLIGRWRAQEQKLPTVTPGYKVLPTYTVGISLTMF